MSMMAGATGRNVGNEMTGGGSGGFSSSFNVGKSKAGYRPAQMQQFSPEQLQLFQRLFGHVGPESFLSKLAGGDQSTFQQIEEPAMRQFQGLQGQIASRFSGMGLGGRRSSGFQNTINQATSDFAKDLQAQRLGLQRQAIQDLLGISGQLLGQRPYENFLIKKDPSFLRQLAMGALGQGGQLATTAGNTALMGSMM